MHDGASPRLDQRRLTDTQLIDRLFTDGDRLERAVVDEIVRRGTLVGRLGRIVSDPFNWNEPLPAWWSVVHAVYILGAIGTPDTVLPLLRALRYADACENDWITGDLPSIFGRVGLPVVDGLKQVAADRTSGWLARAVALEGLAAISLGHPSLGGPALDAVHRYFTDESEERPFRQLIGHILIDLLHGDSQQALADFGREERRLAGGDDSYKAAFTDEDVEQEFRLGAPALEHYTRDWLQFYADDAVAERQKRWDEEQRRHAEAPEHASQQELCPFQADRKKKKCCLGKAGLA